MDIKSAASHLQRLNEPFDVIIIKNGIEQQLYKALAPTNVEGLLNDVINEHNPERLIIQERRKNGNALLRGQKHEINTGGIVPQFPALNGFSGQSPNNIQTLPADFKDYMITDLKEKCSRFETKVERLEAENEKLKRENFELEKDLKFKDKEFEIANRSREVEQTNGLSGLLEKVSENPMLTNLATMAIGRLMGVDTAAISEGEPEQAQNLAGIPELNQKIANNISTWIHHADEQTVREFYALAQHIYQNPEILPELLEQLKGGSDE